MQYPRYIDPVTTRPQDHFIQVQGHTVRYWAQGEAGPTVLLLHGISCSVVEWEHNIAALATQHRVIALDLLGCGLSDKPLKADCDMQLGSKKANVERSSRQTHLSCPREGLIDQDMRSCSPECALG